LHYSDFSLVKKTLPLASVTITLTHKLINVRRTLNCLYEVRLRYHGTVIVSDGNMIHHRTEWLPQSHGM